MRNIGHKKVAVNSKAEGVHFEDVSLLLNEMQSNRTPVEAEVTGARGHPGSDPAVPNWVGVAAFSLRIASV